jgi:hypothetical protein
MVLGGAAASMIGAIRAKRLWGIFRDLAPAVARRPRNRFLWSKNRFYTIVEYGWFVPASCGQTFSQEADDSPNEYPAARDYKAQEAEGL